MELAVTVDCMEPFVKATYNLEGDGFLALEVYERIRAQNIAIMSKHMPNVVAMAKEQACGNSVHGKQLLDYADTCVKPALIILKLSSTQVSNECFQSCMFFFSIKDQFHAAYSK